MSDYTYSPNDPYCVQHGRGHWTKDCEELRPLDTDTDVAVTPPPYDEGLKEVVKLLGNWHKNNHEEFDATRLELAPHKALYRLQALILRAQIAEAELVKQWLEGHKKHATKKPLIDLFTAMIGDADKRIAALHQQLKEVERKQ